MKKAMPVLIGTLLLTASAAAHHSPARFAEDKILTIEGTVVRFDWKNPHTYLVVRTSDGREWMLESNAASNLGRNGWTKEMFAPGDKVAFRAHANVDPAKTHVGLISVVTAAGRTFESAIGTAVARDAGATESASSLEGVWRGDPQLAFKFLFSIFDHPLTDKAARAMTDFDESMDPAANCVAWPTPRLVAWGAFYPVQFEYEDDVVIFTSEYGNTRRVIYLDGRSHPEGGERTNQGHSIGHWEGDTLVVDTRLFADHRSPIADGIPSGEQKHVVENYVLSDDGTKILVNIFLEDPEYLAEPLTADLVFKYSPHIELVDFNCDPESASRFYK
jgi:hypothetical protein